MPSWGNGCVSEAPDHGKWKAAAEKKRSDTDAQLPTEWRLDGELLSMVMDGMHKSMNVVESGVVRECGILSHREIDITENYSASVLVAEIGNRVFTSFEVVTAFCKRAAIAQQLVCCLTETCFSQALDRARWLDEYLENQGKVFGPLHGLPISLKDTFNVQGLQSTIGLVSFLQHPPAVSNSALVDLLLDLGAVVYVKTNVPQTLMTGDSHNNVFGRTLNPLNLSWTAGGSSGGESALVAFRGSPLGVGTDTAGSVRVPAACCGLYGFTPTADRIPLGEQCSPREPGLPGITASAGPMAQNLEDIELFMETVVATNPWIYDCRAYPGPWVRYQPAREDPKLTVGVLFGSKQFPLHPPIQRALEDVVARLEASGHRVVFLERNPALSVSYAFRLAFQLIDLQNHGTTDPLEASGEPAVPAVALRSVPIYTGPSPVPDDLEISKKIIALNHRRREYADGWRKTWIRNRLDVVVAPVSQGTAVPHDTFGWPPYTVMWNLLNYPACVIPHGFASKELDPVPMRVPFSCQPDYDPAAVDKAPCAFQVVAPTFQDEKCLWASRVIDHALRN